MNNNNNNANNMNNNITINFSPAGFDDLLQLLEQLEYRLEDEQAALRRCGNKGGEELATKRLNKVGDVSDKLVLAKWRSEQVNDKRRRSEPSAL